MRERLIELIQDSVNGCARHWAEIIADYLRANGVIVPPCKVGQTVYVTKTNGNIISGTVESIHKNLVGKEEGRWVVTAWFANYYANTKEAGFECGTHLYLYFDDFGKTVFLTKEEAERALKGGVQE